MTAVVVLLHAFPLDHRMWAAQQQGLAAAGWPAVALDLPGFAGTPLLDAEPSLEPVADAIAQHLAADGIDHYVLVGLSLGGYVAMAMARRALARGQAAAIDGLILCDTKASADTPTAVANRIRLAESVLDDSVLAEPGRCGRILRQALLPGLLGATTHASRPEVLAQVGGWLDEAEPATVAWYQHAMAGRPDSHQVLRDLAVPTLVLWGDEDTLSPQDEQASMLAVLARGRESIIEGVGHLSAVEDPMAVTESILAALVGSSDRVDRSQ